MIASRSYFQQLGAVWEATSCNTGLCARSVRGPAMCGVLEMQGPATTIVTLTSAISLFGGIVPAFSHTVVFCSCRWISGWKSIPNLLDELMMPSLMSFYSWRLTLEIIQSGFIISATSNNLHIKFLRRRLIYLFGAAILLCKDESWMKKRIEP